MVASRPVISRRLRIFHQSMLVDLPMRMRFAVGRSGHGMQHPHGSRQALPFLRPRMARAGAGDDRDHRSAGPDLLEGALDMGTPRGRRASDIPGHGRHRRAGSRVVGRVLEPLALAYQRALPAYLNCLWSLNRPTYYLSQWSSGWPLKSSMAEEADAGAVCRLKSARSRLSFRSRGGRRFLA